MLTDYINDALSQGIFPESFKFANIMPVPKKDEATEKENYRPVSVLPLFSKVFEKVIYDAKYESSDLESSFLTTCSVQTIISMARRIRQI